MELKEFQTAIRDFNAVISRERSNEDAIIQRANCNIALGKSSSAMQDFNRIINLNPNNSLAFESRGIVYFEQKRYDQALADLDNSIKIKPTAKAHFYRAKIKDIKKDQKGTCQDLSAAAALGHEEAKKSFERFCK